MVKHERLNHTKQMGPGERITPTNIAVFSQLLRVAVGFAIGNSDSRKIDIHDSDIHARLLAECVNLT
jgi:hypothetical protein